MPFLDQPLIQRVCVQLAPIADEIIVTTNRPADYAFLHLPLFPDSHSGCVTMRGLLTSFLSATHELVVVAGCDMPFASPNLFAYQAQVLETEPTHIVVPLSENGYEPPARRLSS